jgi:hypothetical protein
VNTEPAEKFFPLHGAAVVHGEIDSLSWLDDVDTLAGWKASLGLEVEVLATHTLVLSELPNDVTCSLAGVVVNKVRQSLIQEETREGGGEARRTSVGGAVSAQESCVALAHAGLGVAAAMAGAAVRARQRG